MPKPYSYAHAVALSSLRQKVIQAPIVRWDEEELDRLKSFNSVEIQSTYGRVRKAITGDYQALPNQPPGNNHKITDWEKCASICSG